VGAACPCPCPAGLFEVPRSGLAPLEFGGPNGEVIILGFPSAKAESQALAPSSAATPTIDALPGDRLLKERLLTEVAGRGKDARGVLLNPVIQLPVGSGFP
jgi:hypothetical protein